MLWSQKTEARGKRDFPVPPDSEPLGCVEEPPDSLQEEPSTAEITLPSSVTGNLGAIPAQTHAAPAPGSDLAYVVKVENAVLAFPDSCRVDL